MISRICKLIDENRGDQGVSDGWSQECVAEAVKVLLKEPSTLFDDMRKKMADYPELRKIIYAILFSKGITSTILLIASSRLT